MGLRKFLAIFVFVALLFAGCVDTKPSGSGLKYEKAIELEPYTGKFPPCTEGEKFSGELVEFNVPGNNYRQGYKFLAPKDWEYEGLFSNLKIYPTKENFPYIDVGRDSGLGLTKYDITLENFDAFRINKRLKKDSGIDKIDKSCSTILFGAPAHRIIWTDIADAENANKPELWIKTVELWAKNGGKIEFVALRVRAKDYEKLLPAVNTVINSLELTNEVFPTTEATDDAEKTE